MYFIIGNILGIIACIIFIIGIFIPKFREKVLKPFLSDTILFDGIIEINEIRKEDDILFIGGVILFLSLLYILLLMGIYLITFLTYPIVIIALILGIILKKKNKINN